MLAQHKRITDYYASLNELAAMLADGEINAKDWKVQRDMAYHTYHEVVV